MVNLADSAGDASTMTKSLRIHHRERIKRKRHYHWGRDLKGDKKSLGKAAKTPTPCSCWMCANKRKLHGKTRAEILADLELVDL